jgi:hypothetical protein
MCGNAEDRQMTTGESTGRFGKTFLGLRPGRPGDQSGGVATHGGAEQTRALKQNLQGRRKKPFELRVSLLYAAGGR